MIEDVDATLRSLLAGELARVPGSLVRAPEQITFDVPGASDAGRENGADSGRAKSKAGGKEESEDGGQDGGKENPSATVNLYLHDVRENLALRDETFRRVRSPGDAQAVGLRPAPVRLDLAYLVTTHVPDTRNAAARDTAGEHRLLSEVLRVLLRHAHVPDIYLRGLLAGQGALPLSVAQPDAPSYREPSALWQSLGGTLRPALGLVATMSFDPFETRWTRVVREAVLGVGQGVSASGPVRSLDISGVRVSAAGVAIDARSEQPLKGALICATPGDAQTRADEKGFFALLNLPPGRYTLRCTQRGYAESTVVVSAPVMGRPDLLEPHVVALEPLSDRARAQEAAVLAAQARSAPALIEAARVYSTSLSGTLRLPDSRAAAFVPLRLGQAQTTTDADGVYYFLNVPPGPHRIMADIPGVGEVEVMASEGNIVAETDTPSLVQATSGARREPLPAAPADRASRPQEALTDSEPPAPAVQKPERREKKQTLSQNNAKNL